MKKIGALGITLGTLWIGLFVHLSPAIAGELDAPDFSSNDQKFFSPLLGRHPLKRRNFIWPQLTSLLLPGFDQWWEGQYRSAAFYSGWAITGSFVESAAKNYSTTENDLLSSRDNTTRQYALGSQMYLDAGFISAYQSFRSAVRSQQVEGRFLFLTHEETSDELFASPFAFSELAKPTTFIPLVAILGAGIADAGSRGGRANFTGSDGFYSAAYSYGAGVTEESFFRGYFLPVTYHYMDNRFWSNTTTALVFAAAHIGSGIDFPLPQFILGWYLGYLTQRNDWTLRQSIFIHTWWDVIAFATTYYENSRSPNGGRALATAPLINATF